MPWMALTMQGFLLLQPAMDYPIKKELISIKTEHWGSTANMDGKAVLAGKTNYDMSGKKVLLVDDITDTGESL